MDLVYYLRLLFRHARLIIAAGLLMAVVTYLVTRDQPSVYMSSTIVYTGLATGYTIESGGSSKLDYFGTNAKFDNLINLIKSRITHKETAIRLLGNHIYDQQKGNLDYQHLHILLGEELMITLYDAQSRENTIRKVRKLAMSSDTSKLYKLINSNNAFYGISHIEKLFVRRVQNSDLIELRYETIHPRICQQTLEILSKVFLEKYQKMRAVQTGDVVAYFQARVNDAYRKLLTSEKELLRFRQQNRIINYHEQTRFIAAKKEDFDETVNEEIRFLAAAKAGKLRVEQELDTKVSIALQGGQILRLRKSLSRLTSQLARDELSDEQNADNQAAIKVAIAEVKDSLMNAVNVLTSLSYSKEGVPTASLLTEWLDYVTDVEERESRMQVMMEQKNDFDAKYDRFAPMGARLKQIERKIDVAEEEYMRMLSSLNQAKLKQQNIEMSSNVEILDEPYFPLIPKGSKRKLLILLSFMIGVFGVSGLILLLEYMDRTVRSAKDGEGMLGLQVVGVFPNFGTIYNRKIQVDLLTDRIMKTFVREMRRHQKEEVKKQVILVTSARPGEGKTFLMEKLAHYFGSTEQLYCFVPEGNNVEQNDFISHYPADLLRLPSLKAFKERVEINDEAKILLIEVPAFIECNMLPEWYRQADELFLVVRANRMWTAADKRALAYLQTFSKTEPVALVNGVRLDRLEPMIGEVPRKRSRLRQWLKRMLSMQFFYKHGI